MHVGYNLTWDGFSEHLKNVFNDLNTSKTFTDVTLVCDDDEILKAHRFILSSCSDVFKAMFAANHSSQPCVYLRGIQKREMELILKYMYFGEATFEHELLEKFLNVAKDLKVKDISQDAGNTAFNNALKKEERESQQNTSLENEGKSVNALNEFVPQEEITSFATEEFSTRIDDLPMRDDKPKDPTCKENQRKRKVWCPECNQFFSGSKTKLTTHFQNVHEGIRWPCNQCEYKARDKYTLNKHVRAEHINCTVFKCDDCEYETMYKNRLKAHAKSHLRKLEYSRYNQNASLDNEGKSVNVLNGPLPQEETTSFATKDFSTSIDDLKMRYKDLYKPKDQRKRKRWCPACNKFISGSKTHMTTHYQTIHERIRWPCSQCEYSARDKYTLNKHVRAEHESSAVFKCDDCEYETKYKNLLKSHTKSHLRKLESSFKQM